MAETQENQATTNLILMLFFGSILLCFYGIATFSGPFRWTAEAEMRLFGTYWEPSIYPVVIAGFIAFYMILQRPARRLAPSAAALLTNMVVLAAAAYLVFQAWRMVDYARHIPNFRDPAQVIDLDSFGAGPLPIGHVRLIAAVDDGRQGTAAEGGGPVTGGFPGMTSHKAATNYDFVAIVGRRSGHDATAPVRVVARSGEWDPAKGAAGFDGLLDDGELDNRNIYQLRRSGINVVGRPLVLTGGQLDPIQWYLLAGLLVLPIACGVPISLYQSISRKRSARSATS